jgi:undecaprenyl diphosphate synthase
MGTPHHVAIIMDGNGRWAQLRGRPRTYGHIAGARTAKKIITAAVKSGLKNLTLFTFSTENWNRPQVEVNFLMHLLARQIFRERQTLMKNNVRFYAIGDLARLPEKVRQVVVDTVALTAKNTGMNLVFALSYGGRQEIIKAAQALAAKAAAGDLDPENISEHMFSSEMESHFLPDPDLIIRTSGEERLSNFYLWQAAYSEIIVFEKYWPEFSSDDLYSALLTFSQRERRFGMVTEDVPLKDPVSDTSRSAAVSSSVASVEI